MANSGEDHDQPLEVPARVSQSTIDHFHAIEWIRPTLNNTSYSPVSFSRTVTPEKGHTFSARTLNTDDTIRELISLVRRPSPSSTLLFPHSEPDAATVVRYYTFGDGLNAHPGLLHGGVVAYILDSSLGAAVGVTMQQSARPGLTFFTVQLNTTYKKPVRTPGTIMVWSWVTKIEGRKVWAKGVISGEGGVRYAEAEGLWLMSKQVSQKL